MKEDSMDLEKTFWRDLSTSKFSESARANFGHCKHPATH